MPARFARVRPLATQYLRATAYLLAVASLVACGREAPRCETDLCPAGSACNPASGECEAATATGTGNNVGLLGHLAPVRTAAGSVGVLAFSSERKSLVWLDEAAQGWTPGYLAGPAATAAEAPAGQSAAAVADAAGVVHVAWRRAGDATLWYAVRTSAGWQREQLSNAAAGTVGSAVAIGIWQERPVVAWRDIASQTVRVARRSADGWQAETLPAPAPLPGEVTPVLVDAGRALAMVVLANGPAIAAYEANRGDLLLAVRAGETWNVQRIAGVDPKTGEDTGDVGSPVAAAVGPGGSELVLAYRDRRQDRVLLTRSKSGVISHQTVLDGQHQDAAHQTLRADLLGTALSVAVQPTGLAVVAAQNGSTLRIQVAAEKPAGGFWTYAVPGALQAWPALVSQADGSLACLWLALSNAAHPGYGRLQRWTVPKGEP